MFRKVLINIFTVMFFILTISGCSTPAPKVVTKKVPQEKPQKVKAAVKSMYLKADKGSYKKGDKVEVFEIKENFAITADGKIELSLLENTRGEFRFRVLTPHKATIRILNIKPKYRDGMWLKKGMYHIEVSAPNCEIYKAWVKVSDDTTLNVKLKKIISKGIVNWEQKKGVKYIDGLFWQDQVANLTNKMNWMDAQQYCSNLAIRNGKNIIDDFALPTESELKALLASTSLLDNVGSIYWSSTVDEKHDNFATYVYIDRKKNGWYNKRGSSYVRCVSRKNYPSNISINALAKVLQSENKSSYNEAMESALYIKYAKPIIKHILYDKKSKRFTFTLRSQNHDAKNNYYYHEVQTIQAKYRDSKKIKYLLNDSNFEPIIEFEILNDKLVFKNIKQFK